MSNSTPPPFVPIPAGWFSMGDELGHEDEKPVHRVFVEAFEIGTCPVTREEYTRFLAATDHAHPRDWEDPRFSAAELPVVGVSWHDAVAYAEWRAATEPGLRLPTEAEWERAARGDVDGRRYPWGDEIPAWVPMQGRGALDGPWPVTLGEPTAFGIYGIGGNVHEWCADWFAADYYATSPERQPTGPAHGVRRASRGGSWRHAITVSRCAARSRLDPTFRYNDYGFRLVRSLGSGMGSGSAD